MNAKDWVEPKMVEGVRYYHELEIWRWMEQFAKQNAIDFVLSLHLNGTPDNLEHYYKEWKGKTE